MFLHNSSRLTTAAAGWEILLHVVLYSSRSRFISQEKWVGSEFACFVKTINIIFVNVIMRSFYVFGMLKSQTIFKGFSPWNSKKALPWTRRWKLTAPPPPHPPLPHQTFSCFLRYSHVSCSHNLGTFGATEVDFFSVLTSASWVRSINF